MKDIKIVAFDADDTLWDNEPLFQNIEKELCGLLTEYADTKEISSILFSIEMANLECYGYGAKAFTLSMIETAIKISGGKIPSEIISQIIEKGKYLLNMPIKLLDGVEDILLALQGKYKLIVATKGDLLDQQRKLERSGIAGYFDHVEIMSDKTAKEYNQLAHILSVKPENILMIGNSLKSDILPPLAIGMHAAYVPYHTMWQHEVVDENINNERFYKVGNVRELSNYLL